jgi:MATE family multidrug resistance protein
LITAVYALAGPWLINQLTTLPDVRSTAIALLPWVAVSPLIAVTAFHFDGVFIGTTRTAELRNSMFAAASLFGLVLWLTLDTLGNQGLWLAMISFRLTLTFDCPEAHGPFEGRLGNNRPLLDIRGG